MKKPVTNLSLLVFILCGSAGLIAFAAFYHQAFPEASLDLRLTREQVVDKSRDFLKSRGFDLSGYRSVAVFTEHRPQIDFLERHMGLSKANELFRKTVAVWRWRVRWFKELEEVEYSVEYTPDGRLASFRRTLPISTPGPRLGEDAARAVAEAFLASELGLDLSRYQYVDRNMDDRPGRLDQDLVWRSMDFKSVGDSEYRVAVRVQGDRVGGFTQWLKMPEAWTVARADMAAKRDLLSELAYMPIMLLYLAMLGVFFWRVYAGDVRWRLSLAVAGLAAAVVFLAQVNRLTFVFLSYDTTQSLNVFWLKQFSAPLLKAILAFVLVVPLFAATDAIGRLYLPERTWIANIFSRTSLVSGQTYKQVFLGYGMALAAIGYVTLFYVVGQRWIGVWSPVEVRFSNTFSTYFPAFTAVYTGFSAALVEESTFRLFGIALLYRITRRLWPAVIITALIWGFAHTSYPQEPIWIRGIELTVAGIVYGLVFLRYGIVTVLVSHFVYNVFVGIVPQLQSGRPGLIVNGLFALTLPLLAVVLVRGLYSLISWKKPRAFLSGRGGASHDPAPAPEHPEAYATAPLDSLSWAKLAWCAAASAGLFGGSFLIPQWDFYGEPPPVRLTREQAAQLSKKALAETGSASKGYFSYTIFQDGTYGLPAYAISRFGIKGALERFRSDYGYGPEWVTRWYKEKSVRKMEVSIDDTGRLLSLSKALGETDPGARLDEDSARKLAWDFLSRNRPEHLTDWMCIETDKKDRPNRVDYRLTYTDKNFNADGMQRKMTLIISGDTVTFFGPLWYHVPEDWSRKRAVVQKEWRNTARQFVGVFSMIGLTIFFIIQVVLLFRRRVARRGDVKQALFGAVAIGALPAVLDAANSLSSFYQGYFFNTEQAISTYTMNGLLTGAGQIVAIPATIFLLFLVTQMALRQWMPEYGDLTLLLRRLHPSYWRSKTVRQGLILGIAAAALSSSLSRMIGYIEASVSPDLFSPAAETTNINISEFFHLFNFVTDKVPGLFVIGLGSLLVVAMVRRFLRTERFVLALIVLFMFFVADNQSLTWRSLLTDWACLTGEAIVIYLLVTRVLRWNVMAYLTWMWIELNQEAILNFKRFAFSASPEFFWPSIEQMVMLVIPLAAALSFGFLKGKDTKIINGGSS